MSSPEKTTSLTYIDSDGATREIGACEMYVDKAGRYWLWSEYLEIHISYKTRTRYDSLLAAIDSLLFTIKLRDERIASLQRVADLATAFADQIKPDDPDT